jgi:hypothetical protein
VTLRVVEIAHGGACGAVEGAYAREYASEGVICVTYGSPGPHEDRTDHMGSRKSR